jgi:hypothetical protein
MRTAFFTAIFLALVSTANAHPRYHHVHHYAYRHSSAVGSLGGALAHQLQSLRARTEYPTTIQLFTPGWPFPAQPEPVAHPFGLGAGMVVSRSGARASVSASYASQFQGLINDLEAYGARITFMGGYRAGVCSLPAHKHPCGMALDICQLARGVVDGRCNLPNHQELSRLAQAHGLFSGGDWCNDDYGHVEAGGSVACGHGWATVRPHRWTRLARR